MKKSEDPKKTNRKALKKSSILKKVFYPFLLFLETLRLRKVFSGRIDKFVSRFGIIRSQEIFFRHKEFSKTFKNAFNHEGLIKGNILVVPSMLGANSNLTLINLLIAKESNNYGLNPSYLVCDGIVPVCYKERIGKTRKTNLFFCHECHYGYKRIIKETGIDLNYFSNYYGGKDKFHHEILQQINTIRGFKNLEECLNFSYREYPLGLFAKKSVLRFFLVGELQDNEDTIKTFKNFLEAALIELEVSIKYFEANRKITKAIINNGTLQFEKIFSEVCKKNGIDFVSYETFLGGNSLIFKKNDEVMNLNWRQEEKLFYSKNIFNEECFQKVKKHFDNISKGKDMYAVLNKGHSSYKINLGDKYAVLFTNLSFDTAVIDKNTIFRSMKNWIIETIEFWQTNNIPIKLIIRIHPGEVKLLTASSEFMGNEISTFIKSDNILLFDTHEDINSYELIKGMAFGIVYTSTIGLEIAYRKKPCIVSGNSFYLNKEFVISPQSKSNYYKIIYDLVNGQKFEINENELYKLVYYMYFIRNYRMKGIQTRTPKGERIIEYNDYYSLIKENKDFLVQFFRELMEKEI